jgi:hypothetical protein
MWQTLWEWCSAGGINDTVKPPCLQFKYYQFDKQAQFQQFHLTSEKAAALKTFEAHLQ